MAAPACKVCWKSRLCVPVPAHVCTALPGQFSYGCCSCWRCTPGMLVSVDPSCDNGDPRNSVRVAEVQSYPYRPSPKRVLPCVSWPGRLALQGARERSPASVVHCAGMRVLKGLFKSELGRRLKSIQAVAGTSMAASEAATPCLMEVH